MVKLRNIVKMSTQTLLCDEIMKIMKLIHTVCV